MLPLAHFSSNGNLTMNDIFCRYGVFGFVFNQICPLPSLVFLFSHAIQPCIRFVIAEKKNVKKSNVTKNQPRRINCCHFFVWPQEQTKLFVRVSRMQKRNTVNI